MSDILLLANIPTGNISNPTRSCFFAYPSATIPNVTGNDTQYDLVCDSTLFNVGSNYSTGTGLYTAPVTGKYFFGHYITTNGITNVMQANNVYRINGGNDMIAMDMQPFPMAVSGTLGLSACVIVSLTAGDNFRVNVRYTFGAQVVSVVGGSQNTAFFGYFIC